jgi:hypothetical protein
VNDEEPLLAAACEVRPFLAHLLGKDAAAVDEALARILLSTQPTSDKLSQVQAVFSNDDRLVDWVGQFIAAGSIPPEVVGLATRSSGAGYVDLPGDIGHRPGVRFTCPNGDYTRYLLRKGELLPPCPTCGIALVRAA